MILFGYAYSLLGSLPGPIQCPKKIETDRPLVGQYPDNNRLFSLLNIWTQRKHRKITQALQLSRSLSKMDSFSPEVLLALQALLAKELASRAPSAASAPKVAKAPKVSKEAKEVGGAAKTKRAPGAWAAWTKHAPLAHAKEYAEFKASAVEKQGIAPLFCTKWRAEHPEEYAAFELAHKASASVEPSPAASVPEPAAPVPSPAKEKRKWSEEAKANAAAKRAAKKAASSVASVVAEVAAVAASAPAPLPAPAPAPPAPSAAVNPFDDEEDDAEVELLPFKIGGRTYLRPGSSVAGSAPIWATGDLWESNKGLRGEWAGALQADGSIDMDAEEPEFE